MNGLKKNFHLHEIYHPITAAPFKCTKDYMEFEPCDALKPYIRCFWGTKSPIVQDVDNDCTREIVIPDTCMDIMFTVDLTNNKIYNNFCGIDDRTFSLYTVTEEHRIIFSFAIRFYAWGVSMFAEESMKNTKNSFFDVGYHFEGLKKRIEPMLFEIKDVYQLIPEVERGLLELYNEKKKNNIVLQAIHSMLVHKGNIFVNELPKELHISERQLERLFREYVGVTPKSLASMIRYQYVWNDIVYGRPLDVLDTVYKYGYSDQAHLCHDFKKYHSMNISDAKEYALKSVGNIQENSFCFS